MQTRPIASLISKFENQEFSKPPYITNKKEQFKYENQIKKVTKLNSIFDSSGTLYSGDNNKFSNDNFKSKLERNGKLSKELLEVFEKSDDNNNTKNLSLIKNNYPIHKKINISDYKESTETLINSSSENVFKSTVSFNIPKGESSQSLPPFKTKNSINELLKNNFSYSLSKLDPKENIEEGKLIKQNNENNEEEKIEENEDEKVEENEDKKIEENKEEMIEENEKENDKVKVNDEKKDEEKYYDNFSEKNEEKKNIDNANKEEIIENKESEKNEEKNDTLSKDNENNLEDENFHLFDVNKVLRNIIRVDVNKNDQKKESHNDNNKNNNNNINNNEDKNYIKTENFNNNIITAEKEITNVTNNEKEEQIENEHIPNVLNDSNERLKNEDKLTSDNKNEADELNNNLKNNEDTENLYVIRDLKKEVTLLGLDEENIEINNEVKIREKDKLDNEDILLSNKNEDDNDKNESISLKQENNEAKEEQSYKEKIIDKRYKLTYVLARGGCGEIRATEDLVTGEQLVCKIIPRAKKPKVDKKSNTYQYYLDYELDLLKEATISSLLVHPNILYMKYMVRTANFFYLISEKIEGEDLCDYIIKKGRLSEKKSREIIYEVIVALQYLHSNYIVHRDVKCENIMREKETGRIILLDFGSACFYTNYSSQINEFCGSPVYQAPEVILTQPYWGPELDVWGLGVVLYVLTTGRLPFDPSQPDMNDSNMVDLMYNGPEYPEYLSYECKMLISRMLCFDPNQRAKLSDILKHPWMRSYVQYKKLKEYNFSSSNNIGAQDSNTIKKINKSYSSLSAKTNNSKISIPQSVKRTKFKNILSKTKKLLPINSTEKINKHYLNLQKDQLILNNPFSSNTSTTVNSIFNNDSESNSSGDGVKNVVSQMFAYAVSREDESKENRIKLLKEVMNNQMRIQRDLADIL